MKLILDATYVRTIGGEPQRLKYWERGRAVLRPVAGKSEVGRTWKCPLWLFEKVYRLEMP